MEASLIHYHGGPITPAAAAIEAWKGRHAFVSFAHPDQLALAAEVSQSFALDNGAFSVWKQGGTVDVKAYAQWVNEWRQHPGFDFALIPDVIDGDEDDNNRMIAAYMNAGGELLEDVPVWHLHESLERLKRLCNAWRRVALGSSGQWATPGTDGWWQRMGEAMNAICVNGKPICKLHGLRMLDPEIFSQLPLASADSTNVARNIGLDSRWTGAYQPPSKKERALVLAARIEMTNSAPIWNGKYGGQECLELFA